MTERDDSRHTMGDMDELSMVDADRLLDGELDVRAARPEYQQVSTLLTAVRGRPSPAEMARQADTVQAMVAARRAGTPGLEPSGPGWVHRLARRRDARLGALALVTTMSLTTGLAAAGVLSDPWESLTGALRSSDAPARGVSNAPETAGGPAKVPNDQSSAGSAEAGPALPQASAGPAAENNGSRAGQAQAQAPGRAKQAAKAVLQAEAATSGGQLVVSFRETGVTPDAVTVTARSDATATYGCVRPGKGQKTSKEDRVTGVSQATGRFGMVSGVVGGALTLTAPGPAGVSCPSGEAPQLMRVMYSRVLVGDTTTGASTTINRTFPARP